MQKTGALMRRIGLIGGLLCAILCLAPSVSMAWGVDGHKIIALIAEAQLDPSARKEVRRLLALEPGESLESISTWADEHKNPATAVWHYVNFPRETCAYEAGRDCPGGTCVIGIIEKQFETLRSRQTDEIRLAALKYLVHLEGDVHQPLHAGYADDRGGNKYQLQAFMRGTNLHALWDSGIIKNWSESPESSAARLLSAHKQRSANVAPPAEAAQESCRIVGTKGFYPNRQVDDEYVKRFSIIVEQRLLLAGLRLGAMLNAAMSSEN